MRTLAELGGAPPLAPPLEGALRVAVPIPARRTTSRSIVSSGSRSSAVTPISSRSCSGATSTSSTKAALAGWEQEIAAGGLDRGIHLWPPPRTKEGEDPAKVSRKAIPMTELVSFHQESRDQLGS